LTANGKALNLQRMTIDVQSLGPQELKALIAAAEHRKQLISARRPIGVVRRKLAALAKAAGYTLDELFGAGEERTPAKPRRAAVRKAAKVAPKYRDPDNKRNTWSGRGRLPRWLADKTKHGRSVADFLIPGLARPTARKGASIGQKSVFKQG